MVISMGIIFYGHLWSYGHLYFLNQRKKTIINQFNEDCKEGFTSSSISLYQGRIFKVWRDKTLSCYTARYEWMSFAAFSPDFLKVKRQKKCIYTPGMNECPMRPYWYSSLRRATLAINESLLTMLVSISYPREKIDTKCQTDYISF